jgi:hypothetical protein
MFFLNAAFAANDRNVTDNPYGFRLVAEAEKNSTVIIEPDGTETPDMKEVNESDTYQAQIKAAAEIKKSGRKSYESTKKKPIGIKERQKSVSTEEPKIKKADKLDKMFHNFIKKPSVSKFLNSVKSGWTKFKKWVVTLPGIRHWLVSPYSIENYKKKLKTAGKENSDYLKKDSAGINMVKEGSKKFFK